ncbi:MAG: hypothetical protein KDJ80_00170, partial [Nitratireductor sp.]|nr:hypothetical protein [Nitratireductor sp.]
MAEQHHNEAETRREQTARVFTIAPATPFLPALARFVLDWRSADGRRLADDPATLADSTVFLPTRRAARAFGVALQAEAAQLTGAPVVALPRIATLGDSDEAEALSALVGDFSDLEILAAGMAPIDAWPIDPQERRLVLARLIRGWVEAINPQTRALLKQEAIVLPSSAADSIWLADDLARLIDQIETEEADWQAIRAIVPEDQHLWW